MFPLGFSEGKGMRYVTCTVGWPWSGHHTVAVLTRQADDTSESLLPCNSEEKIFHAANLRACVSVGGGVWVPCY